MNQSGILTDAAGQCDPARSLEYVLDMLVDSNIDEHDEVYSDDEEAFARLSKAKENLISLTAAWRAKGTVYL